MVHNGSGKHSSDMKKQRLEILKDLEKGNMTPEQADDKLLSLSIVSFSSRPKSRCCGRCDGVNDLCVADMVCEEHDEQGCEICYGARDGS